MLLEHAANRARTLFSPRSGAPGPADVDNVLGILKSIHTSQETACVRIGRALENLKTVIGFHEGEWSLVDVGKVLDSAIQLLGKRSRCHIDVSRGHEGFYLVEGSYDQLGQLFTNLLLNGIDAAGSDGKVSVSMNECEDVVVVTILHDGGGIHRNELAEVTSPCRSTAEMSSAAIGLTLCRLIVDQHGGRLDIESEPGRGTSIHVLLPTGGSHVSVPEGSR